MALISSFGYSLGLLMILGRHWRTLGKRVCDPWRFPECASRLPPSFLSLFFFSLFSLFFFSFSVLRRSLECFPSVPRDPSELLSACLQFFCLSFFCYSCLCVCVCVCVCLRGHFESLRDSFGCAISAPSLLPPPSPADRSYTPSFSSSSFRCHKRIFGDPKSEKSMIKHQKHQVPIHHPPHRHTNHSPPPSPSLPLLPPGIN